MPQYPGSSVEVYEGILVKDLGDVPMITEKSTVGDVIKIIPKLVKSWNFTDEKNQSLPVNEKTLGLLNLDALKFLVDEIQSGSVALKKN